MRRPLPRAFYVNFVAGLCFFAAVFIKQQPWHFALQWAGGVALFAAIVLLALRKYER